MPQYEEVPADYGGNAFANEALTVTEFMLSPDIPPRERRYFEKFYLMFSKIMALGNIERRDIFALILAFEEITLLLDMGLYNEARFLMGREIMKMQASRSIGATQLLYGQRGVEKREEVQRVLARKRKKSFAGKVKSAFGRGNEKQERWEEIG